MCSEVMEKAQDPSNVGGYEKKKKRKTDRPLSLPAHTLTLIQWNQFCPQEL